MPTVEEGTFQVVVEYTEEAVGSLALERAEPLVQAALNDTPFDIHAAIAELRELDEDERMGPIHQIHRRRRRGAGIPFSAA